MRKMPSPTGMPAFSPRSLSPFPWPEEVEFVLLVITRIMRPGLVVSSAASPGGWESMKSLSSVLLV